MYDNKINCVFRLRTETIWVSATNKDSLEISHAKFIVKKSRESLKSSFNEPEKDIIPNGTIIDWAFKTKVFPTYHKSNE